VLDEIDKRADESHSVNTAKKSMLFHYVPPLCA